MPASAFALVILAGLIHASWNIAAKKAGGDARFACFTALVLMVSWAPLGLWLGWPQVPGCAPLPAVEAGLHLSVRVESLQRETELVAAALAAGVEVSALSGYWLADSITPPDQRAGLVLGFAAVPEAQIGAALQALRKAWGV